MRYVLALVLLAAYAAAAPPSAPVAEPATIDLDEALRLAREYNPQFLAAATAAASAHEDRVQARAALLPSLNALNQYIYTQGNGTPSGVFVANDGVHIYNNQAVVHAELFSVTKTAEYRRAQAAEAAGNARQEIAARGLAAAVAGAYYTLVTAQRRTANAQQGVTEAQGFFDITRKQEAGGEVAHADVVKAQLLLEQRRRDAGNARTAQVQARLALAVMLFSDVDRTFTVKDDMGTLAALPTAGAIHTLALDRNPEIQAAEAGLRTASYGVKAARGGYFPSLDIQYFYGIDSNTFAIRDPEGFRRLGSAVQATVDIPVWNWGATRSKVRQAELQQRQAQTELAFARRQLQANIEGFYLEAETARTQLDSLAASLSLAEDSLRLTLLRYEAGEATALEVADAQNTLTDARNARDDGLLRFRMALANLQTLTGRF